MKLSLFLLLVSFTFSRCNEKKNEKYLYILSRNSKTKEGNIVLKFNHFNSNISHIGIALDYANNNSLVYNISYDKKNINNSSLIKETFEEFWQSPNKEDNKIWKLPVNSIEFQNAKKYIVGLEKQKIFFDFDTATSKGLYCSEFVYNVLTQASKRFKLKKNNSVLKGLPRMITGYDTLRYYPADFFLNYKDLPE